MASPGDGADAAEQPSPEEKFQKLIAFVKDQQRQDTLREFSIPLEGPKILTGVQILTLIQNNQGQPTSLLENLPSELANMVQDYLSGNDLSMLSLACKTMALQVRLCRTRKIANIAWYELRLDEAATEPTGDKWRELGLLDVSLRGSRSRAITALKAARDQSMDLRMRLREGTLLEEHGYCYVCNKFRPLAKQYWYSLHEHMEPSTQPGTEKQHGRTTHLKTGIQALVEIC